MAKRIKIYGERNTNTNYMSRLIGLNLNVIEIPGVVPPAVMSLQSKLPGNELVRDIYFHLTYGKKLGWKHTCVKPKEKLRKYKLVDSNLVFLTITKNPYPWLLSLYKKPYHQYFSDRPSFEEFLRRPWKTIGRDNINATLHNPIELWNKKNKSYLGLDGDQTIHTTSESIVEDPEAIINNISKQFSIEKKTGKFINYERSTKDQSKDFYYYRDYYLSEKWREELSQEAIAIINESLDQELMNYYGYALLS